MSAPEVVADRIAGHVPGSGRLGALDGYRAMAALFVVLTHVGFQTSAALRGPYAGVLARFDIGVTLFFLLSGFLLSRPILRAHHDGTRTAPVRVYAWHRALRILPGYWFAIIGAVVLVPANHGLSAADWLVQLFVLQTYVPDALLPGLTQMWSLGTEIGFYVVLPLLGWWLLRRRSDDPARNWRRQWSMLAVLALVAQVWRAWCFARPDGPGLLTYWLPNFLDWFALGMALAVLRARPRPLMGRWSGWVVGLAGAPGICWAFAGTAFWVSTTSIAGPLDLTPPSAAEAFIKHILYGAAAFFALLPVAVGDGEDRVSRFFGSRAMTWLGTVSYGIFLWNMAMLSLTFALLDLPTFKGYFWQVLAVELTLTVSIAAVSWYLVERPAMKLRRLVR